MHAPQDWGLNPDTMTYGPNAAWASPFTEPTPEQHALIERSIDSFYRRFLEVVATGRSMTFEQAREAAKGRVWTGKQALELGLVDEHGGLDRAIAVAKQEAGLSPAPTASLVVEWPPRQVKQPCTVLRVSLLVGHPKTNVQSATPSAALHFLL